MSIVLSAEGAKNILTWYFKKVDLNNPDDLDNSFLWLSLYTNNVTPTITSKKSNFTEAVGGGYARKKLTAETWGLRSVNGICQAVQSTQIWNFTGPLDSGAKIMGLFIYDACDNFIGAELSPYSYTPEDKGVYELTPIVMLGNGDVIQPVINAFVVDPPGVSATVTVHLNVSDNIGVTEYALGEDINNFVWRTWSVAGTKTYGFLSEGAKVLNAAVRDEMGNMSAIASVPLTIVLPDTTAPQITSFVVPNIWDTLTIDVTLIASDNKALAGYSLSETSTPGEWTDNPPMSYTFGSGGQKLLYAFVKDTSGNVSLPVSRSVLITYVDIAPPVIASFTIPATSPSRTVPISLIVTDDNNVVAYSLSETNDPGVWVTTKPTEYTFATQGDKSLFAFAKDATGNVSTAAARNTTITVTDFQAPVISVFSIPASSGVLTVPVTLTVTDDVAVVKYSLSETSTPANWVTSLPIEYTFSSAGSKTLYAFAKDVAGNVSAPVFASVSIVFPDNTAPVITTFAIPVTSQSLTVPVTLIATDAIGVTSYSLNETNNPAAWVTEAPISYTFAYEGNRTLYAFAKDLAGNLSVVATAQCLINVPDTVKPVITEFTIPATSYFMKVPVTLLASDNINIAYYSLSTIDLPATWTYDPPTYFTWPTPGTKTLYAFARDDAGNVSDSVAQTVSISLPTGMTLDFDSGSLTGVPITFSSMPPSDPVAWTVTNSACYAGSYGLQAPYPTEAVTWHQAELLKPSVGGELSFWWKIVKVVDNINFQAYYTVDEGAQIEILNIDTSVAGWAKATVTVAGGWIALTFKVSRVGTDVGSSTVYIDNVVMP